MCESQRCATLTTPRKMCVRRGVLSSHLSESMPNRCEERSGPSSQLIQERCRLHGLVVHISFSLRVRVETQRRRRALPLSTAIRWNTVVQRLSLSSATIAALPHGRTWDHGQRKPRALRPMIERRLRHVLVLHISRVEAHAAGSRRRLVQRQPVKTSNRLLDFMQRFFPSSNDPPS